MVLAQMDSMVLKFPSNSKMLIFLWMHHSCATCSATVRLILVYKFAFAESSRPQRFFTGSMAALASEITCETSEPKALVKVIGAGAAACHDQPLQSDLVAESAAKRQRPTSAPGPSAPGPSAEVVDLETGTPPEVVDADAVPGADDPLLRAFFLGAKQRVATEGRPVVVPEKVVTAKCPKILFDVLDLQALWALGGMKAAAYIRMDDRQTLRQRVEQDFRRTQAATHLCEAPPGCGRAVVVYHEDSISRDLGVPGRLVAGIKDLTGVEGTFVHPALERLADIMPVYHATRTGL